MRLRIVTNAPLPPLKAWFFDGSLQPSATILDLKDAICSHIHSFRDAHIQGREIALSLNEFELLNELGINVVRDGDLISIKLVPSQSSGKRKASREGS